MKDATKRSIIRWIHIVFSMPILGYIYSPFEEIPKYAGRVRFVVVPYSPSNLAANRLSARQTSTAFLSIVAASICFQARYSWENCDRLVDRRDNNLPHIRIGLEHLIGNRAQRQIEGFIWDTLRAAVLFLGPCLLGPGKVVGRVGEILRR